MVSWEVAAAQAEFDSWNWFHPIYAACNLGTVTWVSKQLRKWYSLVHSPTQILVNFVAFRSPIRKQQISDVGSSVRNDTSFAYADAAVAIAVSPTHDVHTTLLRKRVVMPAAAR